MTVCAPVATRRLRAAQVREESRPTGLGWLLAAEIFASAVGFGLAVHWARRLGPSAFAHVEYALAVSAWLLVVVRGGIEVIVYREAARRPRLVHPLTEVLLGLKCACAVLGYSLVAVIAWLVGPERGAVVAVAGLVLVPSAFVADVGPRAAVRLGWIALAQAVRACGYAATGFWLVSGPGHSVRAACCAVASELLACSILSGLHASLYRMPRPRWRRRAWAVLAHRGAIASATRFLRVSLYGADLLVLGWWAGAELGPYAAARRVVFVLVALGLVVSGAVGPAISRAWLAGESKARKILADVSTGLWGLALPASVGLALTSSRWMPLLFGPGYRAGGPWLALVAIRLPWLLSSSLSQSALVACRREMSALRLVLGMALLALAIVPVSVAWFGPGGAGLSVLIVEVTGAICGWLLLRRLNVAPFWLEHSGGCLLGCLAMVAVCRLVRSWSVIGICVAGAIAYGLTWMIWQRWMPARLVLRRSLP